MQHAAAAASLDQYCQFTASYCINNSHLYSLRTQPDSECNSLPTQGTPILIAGKVERKEQLNMANATEVLKSVKQGTKHLLDYQIFYIMAPPISWSLMTLNLTPRSTGVGNFHPTRKGELIDKRKIFFFHMQNILFSHSHYSYSTMNKWKKTVLSPQSTPL